MDPGNLLPAKMLALKLTPLASEMDWKLELARDWFR